MLEYKRVFYYTKSVIMDAEFDAATADETQLVIDDAVQGVNPHMSMPDEWSGVCGVPVFDVCCWRRRMEQ